VSQVNDDYSVTDLDEKIEELKKKPHLASMFSEDGKNDSYLPNAPGSQPKVPGDLISLGKLTEAQVKAFRTQEPKKYRELLASDNKRSRIF